jgi:hypothetical protein
MLRKVSTFLIAMLLSLPWANGQSTFGGIVGVVMLLTYLRVKSAIHNIQTLHLPWCGEGVSMLTKRGRPTVPSFPR